MVSLDFLGIACNAPRLIVVVVIGFVYAKEVGTINGELRLRGAGSAWLTALSAEGIRHVGAELLGSSRCGLFHWCV